jgi:hypothetical protein
MPGDETPHQLLIFYCTSVTRRTEKVTPEL